MMTPDRRSSDSIIEAHVEADSRRWLMLVWAIVFSYMIGTAISVALFVYIDKTRVNTNHVRAANCVIVKLIEDSTDREQDLANATRKSLRSSSDAATRTVRLRSLAIHEQAVRQGRKLSADLRANIACPPHMIKKSLTSP